MRTLSRAARGAAAFIVCLAMNTPVESLAQTAGFDIIPRPVSLVALSGSFAVDSATAVLVLGGSSGGGEAPEFLARLLRGATGGAHPVTTWLKKMVPREGIVFVLVPDSGGLGPEGYELDITPHRLMVRAAAPAGHFYAVQTILQLLPPDIYAGPAAAGGRALNIPCARIVDYPRFPYRGMHLDVSRHFFPVEFIKKYIDLIAMHKMNIFHWDLTNDNGWRLEIKKYPELTGISAWRVDREDRPWKERAPQEEGEAATYGGFYTQEQIRDIVRYAAARHVRVLPAIEMPGHASEVFAAYPELSCRGERIPVQPGSYWPNVDIFCAGNDQVFTFLEDVLTELMDLFPYEYVHIGGDEANKVRWKECGKCQARMRVEGLKDEAELQSYFVKRIERFVTSKGRRIIGWDEILEGGLAPGATVMSWRGLDGGIEAARQGHAAIMTPESHCYFNFYQADPATEPEAYPGYLTLRTVYGFEPVPEDLTAEESRLILGAQGNLWSEYIPTPRQAEYQVLPRMSALAEVVWSPREGKDWDDFRSRLESHLPRLEALGVSYSRGSFRVDIHTQFNGETGTLELKLLNEQLNPAVHYTLNGDDPEEESLRYTLPVPVTRTVTVKAGIFVDGRLRSSVSAKDVDPHAAAGSAAVYQVPWSTQYPSTQDALVDGLHGGFDHADGYWQGFRGTNAEVMLTLPAVREIREVAVRFLERPGSWIYLPAQVSIETSSDGTAYTPVPFPVLERLGGEGESSIHEYRAELPSPQRVGFIRMRAVNLALVPPGRPGEGQTCWMFLDEIVAR